METRDRGNLCQYLQECVDRARAEGSAAVQVVVDYGPGMAEFMAGTAGVDLRGQIDFATDRCRITATAEQQVEDVLLADGRLLYARQHEGCWTRARLPSGRYPPLDPRGLLDLLVTGCESVEASGGGEYQVQYEHARAVEWAHPNLAPDWTSITGTVTVDADQRVTKVSVRLANDSGEGYMETTASLADFGTPVQIEPPSDDDVMEHDAYLRERYGS